MNNTYIKDNQIFVTPIQIITENGIIFTNDLDILTQNGFEVYNEPVIEITEDPQIEALIEEELTIIQDPIEQIKEKEKTIEELIEESNNNINKQTDANILTGFFWNGNQFYLSMENQFNFANMYNTKDIQTYPLTVKTMNGFTQLESADAVSAFYVAGVNFIHQCLEIGWIQKAQTEEEIRRNHESDSSL